jgi:alpha-amylase
MQSSLQMLRILAALTVLANAARFQRFVQDHESGHLDLPGCDVYRLNQCNGDQISADPAVADNKWFTPLKGDADYIDSFQDYGRLVGYAHVSYNADRSSASVEVRAEHADARAQLTYVFAGSPQASATKSFSVEQKEPLEIEVQASDGARLVLEAVDFVWNAPAIAPRAGDFRGGQKGAIVEFFGWPHKEVEKECPHLAAMGYMGLKLFPAQEQVMATEPYEDVMNPWYFMYQPVSYRLEGRMGTRQELRSLVHTCRKYGVRVYADAVINHMSGSGNDANVAHRNPQAGCANWGNKSSSLPDGHSPYFTQGFTYTTNPHTGKPPMQEFPAVPSGPMDFHCDRPLNSWSSPVILNAGWLSGLTDLATEREEVRERIATYLTDIISIGMSGFRIDAAKHIRPDDLVAILSKVRRNLGGHLPTDFITWLEVLLGGEADLLICNKDSGYNYGYYLTDALRKAGFSGDEVPMVKTWNSGYPKEAARGMDGCNYSPEGAKRQVIQVDDHDQQNPGSSSRDMQDKGCVLIKGCPEQTHRNFEIQLFSSPPESRDNNNDYPIRMVLSSFYWGPGGVAGIPDGLSDCSLCTTHCERCKGVPHVAAYDAYSKGYDKGDGQYTRVHRDIGIVNAMRQWVGLPDISEGE